jgi:hypothetical protein
LLSKRIDLRISGAWMVIDADGQQVSRGLFFYFGKQYAGNQREGLHGGKAVNLIRMSLTIGQTISFSYTVHTTI